MVASTDTDKTGLPQEPNKLAAAILIRGRYGLLLHSPAWCWLLVPYETCCCRRQHHPRLRWEGCAGVRATCGSCGSLRSTGDGAKRGGDSG